MLRFDKRFSARKHTSNNSVYKTLEIVRLLSRINILLLLHNTMQTYYILSKSNFHGLDFEFSETFKKFSIFHLLHILCLLALMLSLVCLAIFIQM